MSTAGVEKKISQDEFDKIFEQVDRDESGTIEKDEMAILVKRLAGYWAIQYFTPKDYLSLVRKSWEHTANLSVVK